jgi:hypothetical protein
MFKLAMIFDEVVPWLLLLVQSLVFFTVPNSASRWLCQKLYKIKPIFGHGQLYMTFWHRRSHQNIKIQVIGTKDKNEENVIRSIVYNEILIDCNSINCSLNLCSVHFPVFHA